ncbi:MAG TPA: ABC transporter permease [Candidatus Dormibacteraeota bacterium]|nr:ABC transporter permease [Candidatus Dormibacteraeota bacterium]
MRGKFSEIPRQIRMLFHREKFHRDLDEEMRLHIELRERELREAGLSPDAAHTAARKTFGNALALREASQDSWGWAWLEHLAQDLRFAFRILRKSPGFTAVAILTLALGIGANTAIFSVVYGVLLQPLPYKDASRLVVLNETTPKVGTVSVSYPNFLDWRAQSHDFSQMAAVHDVGFNLAGVTQPENISGEAVSPNFLSMIGVRPFLGRDFDASEEKPGTAPVVLLSYELWQSHMGGDRNAIGRTITLDGRSFTIVGVLPPKFRSLDKTDVMLPIGVWATNNSEEANERGERGDMIAIGRLAPNITFAQAHTEMEGIAARLAKEYPASNDQFGVALQTVRNAFVGDARPAILVLFGAVMFVLLIACANVANLFLVRGAARAKEIALRMAFGASRSRIIRQMLTESFVLAFLGGALGLTLAIGGIRGITHLIPMDMLSGASVNLNGAVLFFAAGIIVLAAFIFGLAPAMHSTRPDVQSELKEGGRTASASAAQNKLRGALAIAEISLALILLVGAGLMMKSLYKLLSVDPGFQPDHVLTMEMELRAQQYSKDPAILNFWQQLLDRVRALPGVGNAAVGTVIPLTDAHSRTDVTIEGMALPKPGNYPHPDYHEVSPGFIGTLGIPLLRGRTFTDADKQGAPLVGMVNAKLAKQYWPNEDPIGKRFMFGHPDPTSKSPPKWITVVGVVGDTKLYGLANPSRLEVYVSSLQYPDSGMRLVVKSRVDPASLISAIRAAVATIDKDQPIFAISTMNQLVSDSVATRRITLVLLGLFSALALVLAAIGIYGVISYSVAQRTHEIGIRMALGAQHTDVLRMVLKQGAKIAIAGVAIGVAASLGLMQLMSSLLFGVSAGDPLTFTGVAILLVLVALLACYIPARRALRVDPMVALRYE